jgi:acetyl esterase/lipase
MNSVVQYVNILAMAASMAAPLAGGADGPSLSSREWASLVGQRFRAERGVVYRRVDGKPLAVDIYLPYTKPADRSTGPTVLYIHGGGWENGSKEQYVLWYLPYLELGMRVVAVQYRLSGVAPAPAAAEDCACALAWLYRQAAKYGVDTQRVVVTGGSAGGHLALLAAFGGAGIDCPDGGVPGPRPAAVINYYGPTDLVALYRGGQPSLRRWLRGAASPEELARRLSPTTWVRDGLPPVLTLHGDADQVVPFAQAESLHAALARARVPNELIRVRGGAHGRHTWTDEDTLRVQRAIENFLTKHRILAARAAKER